MKFITRFKLILVAIAIVPALAVSLTYTFRAQDTPKAAIAASNAKDLDCVSGPTDVEVNQCVTWIDDPAIHTRFIQVILSLLAVETGLALAVTWLLRATPQVLFLRNFAAMTGAILGSVILVILLNVAFFPHSQQHQLVGATKVNGIYRATSEPPLGYGPMNVSLIVLVSLMPSLGLAAGSVATVFKEHRKYGGMSKEKLFQ